MQGILENYEFNVMLTLPVNNDLCATMLKRSNHYVQV